MGRHAYLIMAHQDFYTLEKIVELLDDERNDIYIHIDKKVNNFDFNLWKKKVNKSNIYFMDKRIDVRWAAPSSIKVELELLEYAIKKKYEYYHLISGADLPIKTQNYIHDFFDNNKGKEFIGFNNIDKDRYKAKYYYYLAERTPRNKNILHYICIGITKISILIQKIIKVDRLKNKNITIGRGPNWFSITHELAKNLVSCKDEIINMYKYTQFCDEIFVQTYIINHYDNYKNIIYNFNNEYESCLRYVDWNRGWPYTFTIEDYDEIMNSNKLFARKFNSNTDKKIIDKIYSHLQEEQKIKI